MESDPLNELSDNNSLRSSKTSLKEAKRRGEVALELLEVREIKRYALRTARWIVVLGILLTFALVAGPVLLIVVAQFSDSSSLPDLWDFFRGVYATLSPLLGVIIGYYFGASSSLADGEQRESDKLEREIRESLK